MEQLNKVYDTFKNLDIEYSKSKLSKSEFIKSKFGGDINVGSTIILDFLSSQQFDEQDDIEKISFIRDIFEKIKTAQNDLDKLPNFKFELGINSSILLDSIRRSMLNSGNIVAVSQKEFNKALKAIHFVSTTAGAEYVPIQSANVLSIFNSNMLAEVINISGIQDCNIGDVIVRSKGNKYSKKTLKAASRYM